MPRLAGPVRWQALALVAIIALAAVLRFYHLDLRGLLYWDEAKFALEGIRLEAVSGHLFAPDSAPIAGKAVGTAKPTHAVLMALALALLGVHDYAALYMNAAASLAELALTFLVARRLFGVWPGLLSSLLLAVSRYDIIYARSALSESDGNALFMLAVYLVALAAIPFNSSGGEKRVRYAPVLAAGLIAGLAFTVNYRVIVFIGALLLLLLVRPGPMTVADRWLPAVAVGAGCLVAPICWELIDLLARLDSVTLFRSELTGRPSSYLAEVFYQLHQGKQSRLLVSPTPYIGWFVARQGVPAFVLLLLGVAMALVRRTYPWILVVGMVLIPYAVYVFAPFAVPRNLDLALPFVSILSGTALVSLVQGAAARGPRSGVPVRARQGLSLVLGLAVVAYGLAASWQLTSVRSGFVRAAEYLGERQQDHALSTSEIMVFYLRGDKPGCFARHVPEKPRGLSADIHHGYTYLVVENHRKTVMSARILSRLSPVAVFPTLGVTSGENLISEENGNWPGKPIKNERVELFYLGDLPLPAPGPRPPDRCNPNRVI